MTKRTMLLRFGAVLYEGVWEGGRRGCGVDFGRGRGGGRGGI